MTWAARRAASCVLLVAAVCAALPRRSWAGSLTFDLQHAQRKCFTETLPYGSQVRGTVHVSSGKGDMRLDLFVSDSRGKVYFHRADVNSVKFSFTVAAAHADARGQPRHAHNEPGHGHDYGQGDVHGSAGHYVDPHSRDTEESLRFCVVHQTHPHAAPGAGVSRRVSLEVSAESERHAEAVKGLARAADADKISVSFSQVAAEVDTLIEKLDDLRVREQQLVELNETTSSAIVRISLVACAFTVAAGALNFMSLKSFFKQKKLA